MRTTTQTAIPTTIPRQCKAKTGVQSTKDLQYKREQIKYDKIKVLHKAQHKMKKNHHI